MPNSSSHQRAAELHDSASHAHFVAQQHGQADHLSGNEYSRQALEHSELAHRQTQLATKSSHGIVPFGHAEIAQLAEQFWKDRGCPNDGTAQQDWFRAAEELRSRAHT